MSRKDIITTDEIMNLTDNGRYIFEQEFGSISSKKIASPFHSDSDPSLQIKRNRNGIWVGKDYGGDQFYGNAISFVAKKYNLSFPEAIDKIVQDLGLREKSKDYKPIQKTPYVKIEKSIPFIEFVEDFLLFDPTNTKEFDYAMCAGWNEVAEKVKPKTKEAPQHKITDYFRRFSKDGRVIG